MGSRPYVPAALKHGPFTLADARRAGISRRQLQGESWTRIGPRTYLWAGLAITPRVRLVAVARRLPPESVFAGLTAAWLHGLDVEPCAPIEVVLPKRCKVSGRSGALVRRCELARSEVVLIRGMKATSTIRTLKDLCQRLPLTEAVVLADAAVRLRLLTVRALRSAIRDHAGRPGVDTLRRVAAHVEPASESPMETRLRMLLVLAGLPRPQAQVSVCDSAGRVLGRPDLFYEARKLGLEYDGGTHRDSLAEDNRRQNRLVEAGVTLLRFTAADVLQRPESVISLVRSRLAA